MRQLSNTTIKAIKVFVHISFIAFIAVRLIYAIIQVLPNDWLFFITSDAIENFTGAAIAYSLHYYVFKSRSIWQRVFLITGFMIVLSTLAGLKDYRIHNANSFEQSFEYLTNFVGLTLLFYLFLYFVNKMGTFNHNAKLQRELNIAREQLLRNHMHPHFLFNAFNSIYSLCLKNSTEAAEYILKLSSMMRYLTDEAQHSKVPLNKELDFIKRYIDIEKMRFGADAPIQLVTDGQINADQFIEPFLLITLVENAFKHGYYTNSKDAFVKMSLSLADKQLLFAVENSILAKQHFHKTDRVGKGLENLKERLHLLYPKTSNLAISTTANSYTTTLKIILD